MSVYTTGPSAMDGVRSMSAYTVSGVEVPAVKNLARPPGADSGCPPSFTRYSLSPPRSTLFIPFNKYLFAICY